MQELQHGQQGQQQQRQQQPDQQSSNRSSPSDRPTSVDSHCDTVNLRPVARARAPAPGHPRLSTRANNRHLWTLTVRTRVGHKLANDWICHIVSTTILAGANDGSFRERRKFRRRARLGWAGVGWAGSLSPSTASSPRTIICDALLDWKLLNYETRGQTRISLSTRLFFYWRGFLYIDEALFAATHYNDLRFCLSFDWRPNAISRKRWSPVTVRNGNNGIRSMGRDGRGPSEGDTWESFSQMMG